MRLKGVKCEYAFRDDPDRVCSASPLRATIDSETGPRCRVHDLAERGELSAEASRMAQLSAMARRAKTEAKPSTGLEPGVTLRELLDIVRPCLTARYEHDGSPDYGVRLAAVGTILAAFPRHLRDSPERVQELLRAVIPADVLSPEMEDAGRVYREMRALWDEIDGVAYSRLKGLFVRPYPSHYIAPWEDRVRIQAAAARRAPAGRASQIPDGRWVYQPPPGSVESLPRFLEEVA